MDRNIRLENDALEGLVGSSVRNDWLSGTAKGIL